MKLRDTFNIYKTLGLLSTDNLDCITVSTYYQVTLVLVLIDMCYVTSVVRDVGCVRYPPQRKKSFTDQLARSRFSSRSRPE